MVRSESRKERIGQNTSVQHVARVAVINHPVFWSNVRCTGIYNYSLDRSGFKINETIVSLCTGRIRVSRVRVLSLLRQPLVHFEFAHCRPVSYLAVQIRQYLRRRTGEARWKIGAQFPRILEAESLHSTASSSYRVLQKIGTSVQFNSIWTGVTFQLADVPRWISDTHGIFSDPSKVHYYFSIHRSCFINDRHNFDNLLLFFILLLNSPRKTPLSEDASLSRFT